MKTIVIDPGHGGSDSGALGHGNSESWLNLDVAKRVKILLDPCFKVLMTRESDNFVSLSYRSRLSNENNSSAFISIHFNSAGPGSLATGWEIFTSPNASQEAEALAASIGKRHAESFPAQVARGLKQSPFHVLQSTRCPAILWEGGFISSQLEADFIAKEKTRQVMAEAIAAGVMDHFDIAIEQKQLTILERVAKIERHLGL